MADRRHELRRTYLTGGEARRIERRVHLAEEPAG